MSPADATQELSTQAASTAFQLAWGAISKVGKGAWDKVTLAAAMDRYAERYLLRHGQVKVLGMNAPVPLSTIYTAVQLVPSSGRYTYGDVDTLKESLKSTRGFLPTHQGATPGMRMASREKRLNVLGAPGAGKSTFLKRIGLEALLPRGGPFKSEYTPECFPVFIELRRFKNEVVDLIQALVAEFDACGLPESENFVLLCLSQGRLLLLFDGVDEIPTDKLDVAIQHISDFADKYDKNRFVTSCRTAFYKTFFQKFVDVELTIFDDRQIRTFVRNWFAAELDQENRTAQSFISLLYGVDHRPTLELARTPLLLTFLCLVYDAAQRFPANRSSLYRRALLILMERWAAEKRVHNSPVSADLHVELEMELLAEISARAYVDDQILFSQQELLDRISGFMRNTLGAPSTLDARAVLDAIQIQQGLIVERAIDAYSFSHLTIQEFLTAEFFHSPGRMSELVEQHMFEERWREVFLLSSGLSGADELLLRMLDRCDTFIKANSLVSSWIHWGMELVTETESLLDDAVMRIFVLSLPLRFKRYTEFGRDRIEQPANDLLDALRPGFLKSKKPPNNLGQKSAIKWLRYLAGHVSLAVTTAEAEAQVMKTVPNRPLATMQPGSRYAYSRQVTEVFYRNIRLPDSLCNLSRPKARDFQRLLYAYKLIIDCKIGALRLSTATWDEICRRLGTEGGDPRRARALG